ncbi:MAG: hypothetical protein ACHQAX_09900, partial [Gammaproteobacteria bacterium]
LIGNLSPKHAVNPSLGAHRRRPASDGLGERFPNGPDQSMLLFKCQANEGAACTENKFDIVSLRHHDT